MADSAFAAIALEPLDKRVADAAIIVTGKITQEKTEDGWHHGHITVAKVIKGDAKVGGKISVRWKVAPPPPPPGVPRLPDYTYRPPLDMERVIMLRPLKEGDKSHSLNWGCAEHPEMEEKIAELAKG